MLSTVYDVRQYLMRFVLHMCARFNRVRWVRVDIASRLQIKHAQLVTQISWIPLLRKERQ